MALDGRLHVDGRASELIITGGENVWPEPIEAAAGEHPDVADVAVTGTPTSSGVRPSSPSSWPLRRRPLEAIRATVKEQLPAYWAPRGAW